MLYQEDLREGQVVAIWVGDVDTEGELTEYLGTPFESDFGFLLDYDDLPDFSRLFSESRLHAHYTRPFLKTKVRELIEAFPWSAELKNQAEQVCRAKGVDAAKTVVAFPNFRYPENLCKNPYGLLRFIANLPWPEGAGGWAALQSKRLLVPPFPKLIRHDFGEEESNLWYWRTHVHLESWKGFATHSDISSMGWSPARGCLPEGDFSLSVDPLARLENIRPTPEQANAYEILIRDQTPLRAAVLAAIFLVYPKWRDNHFGGEWGIDGGKTLKSGWELPEMFPPEEMPEIKSAEGLLRIIRPGGFGILAESNNGIAQMRVGFNCKWDEEHGFVILVRRGTEIEVGDSDLGI